MTIQVLSSKDQAEAIATGVIPVPPEVQADNEAQEAKREAAKNPEKAKESKARPALSKDELAAMDNPDDPDNVEGDDGLTPRQKRIFTESMQKTIAKKHREAKSAEELATRQYNEKVLAEQRAENLARELEQIRAKKPEPVVVESKPPQRGDFETDDAYQDAVVDYKVDQRMKRQEAEQEARRQEQQQAEVMAQAVARVERARELVPDWQETVSSISTEIPAHLGGYLEQSELLPELSYHLAKNPKEFARIVGYTEGLKEGSPAWQKAAARSLVDIGKIEATLQPFAKVESKTPEAKVQDGKEPSLETGSAPSKPRVPAPIIRPLNTGGATQVDKPEAEMSAIEARQAWERRNGISLTARKRH